MKFLNWIQQISLFSKRKRTAFAIGISLKGVSGPFTIPSKEDILGFPGGAVVENLPANAGDTGSSPGLGRSHMPRSDWAREPQLLSLSVWSLCSATREAAIVRGPRTAMKKSGPRLLQLEKVLAQKWRPNTAKNKQTNKTKNKNWKQSSCPSAVEWLNQLVYPHHGYYSARKSWYTTTWMNPQGVMLNEKANSQRL